jgi:hypothetical protein
MNFDKKLALALGIVTPRNVGFVQAYPAESRPIVGTVQFCCIDAK